MSAPFLQHAGHSRESRVEYIPRLHRRDCSMGGGGGGACTWPSKVTCTACGMLLFEERLLKSPGADSTRDYGTTREGGSMSIVLDIARGRGGRVAISAGDRTILRNLERATADGLAAWGAWPRVLVCAGCRVAYCPGALLEDPTQPFSKTVQPSECLLCWFSRLWFAPSCVRVQAVTLHGFAQGTVGTFALSAEAFSQSPETKPRRSANLIPVNLTLGPTWTEGITNRNMEKLAAPCHGKTCVKREGELNGLGLST